MVGAGGEPTVLSAGSPTRRKPGVEGVTGPCEAVAIQARLRQFPNQDMKLPRSIERIRFWPGASALPPHGYAGLPFLLMAITAIASSHGRLGARPLQHVERQRWDGNGGRRRGRGVLQETGARRQQIEQQLLAEVPGTWRQLLDA